MRPFLENIAGGLGSFITMDLLWPFLAAVLLIELTPGPNMGYLAIITLQRGKRAGLVVVAGITVGLFCYMIATVAGLARVIASAPWLYEILRWVGVLYLIGLSVEMWRKPKATDPSEPDAPSNGLRLFWRGVAVNLLNPKALIFYVALLPAFTVEARGHLAAQTFRLGLIHIVVSVIIHTSIVLGTATTAKQAGRWAAQLPPDLPRRGFACALGAIAIWLLLTTGRTA
jgi:threonine/homoserine/homoserine lactone efflux protein